MNNPCNNTIRVAILVRQFPNIVQTYVLTHILALKKLGIKTLIIAKNDPKQSEIHPSVIHHKLLEDTLYIDAERNGLAAQLIKLPFTRYRFWRAVVKIIFSNVWKRYGIKYGLKSFIYAKSVSKCDFDIVHSHSLFSTYDYLFLKDTFGKPITTTFHGLVPRDVKMLEAEKIRDVIDNTNAFFVNTQFAMNQLCSYGCERNKVHIIPQGTNISDFPYKPRNITEGNPIVILSVGRLSIEKGFHIAINAVSRLKDLIPDIEYRIVGSGTEMESLSKQILDLELQDTVRIFGSVSTNALRKHYETAHFFILPSIDLKDGTHTETQGVVLQEAQSSGIPVIASKTGGIPEVIKDRVTGLLFEEGDDKQLFKLIHSLATDAGLYKTISENARKDVENNYSTDVVCSKLVDVYNKILASA